MVPLWSATISRRVAYDEPAEERMGAGGVYASKWMAGEEAVGKYMVNENAQALSRKCAGGTPAMWALLAIALVLTSCGTAPAANPITVTIFPTSTSVNVNIATTFAASAAGGTTNTVTWQVNGVKGGSTATGTINTNGL